jgi:hypothetical protein
MTGSWVAKLGSNFMVSIATTVRFDIVLMANTAACLKVKVNLPWFCQIFLRPSFALEGSRPQAISSAEKLAIC